MLTFEKQGPKSWTVSYEGYEPITLNLSPSSVTNKFFIVTEYIQNVAEHCGKEFSDWFMTLLKDCKDEDKRPQAVIDSIPKMKEFSDSYITAQNIDFNLFVDETKVKKNSILFKAEEIEKIIRLSCYLKIYSVISNNEDLKLGQKLHKDAYNKIASEIAETDIILKIYNVIKTKTFRYNLTDRFMWDYIKNVQCKDIGVHIIEIFNFIMNHILILCEIDKNPITYFVGVIDESVKWFLRSVYKGSIVYDDSISTEDIQGINTDNLKTYSYNDTLGRLKGIAYEKIYEILSKQSIVTMDEKSIDEDSEVDKAIVDFHERMSQINFISPICETIVFPILAKMTDIPYNHFKTLSPEHAAVISVYVQDLFSKVFGIDYKNLFRLLSYHPLKAPSISTTYVIKAVHYYLSVNQELLNFYGFKAKILPYKLLCHYVGRISRVDFCSVIDGKRLGGIPLSKIENDMILFYTRYFANALDPKIEAMTRLMNADF